MKFSLSKEERYVGIKPEEKSLTAVFAPSLKTEFVILSNEGYRNIICDLEMVDYVDSSGLSAFLIGERLCNESKGKFVLCNLSESVQKLIELSQLDSIFNIFPTYKEAVDFVLLNELERDLRE